MSIIICFPYGSLVFMPCKILCKMHGIIQWNMSIRIWTFRDIGKSISDGGNELVYRWITIDFMYKIPGNSFLWPKMEFRVFFIISCKVTDKFFSAFTVLDTAFTVPLDFTIKCHRTLPSIDCSTEQLFYFVKMEYTVHKCGQFTVAARYIYLSRNRRWIQENKRPTRTEVLFRPQTFHAFFIFMLQPGLCWQILFDDTKPRRLHLLLLLRVWPNPAPQKSRPNFALPRYHCLAR